MGPMSAVVFLPRQDSGPSVMLGSILFDPAALWLCESLKRAGVERFLVVCHHKDRERVAACFPEDALLLTEGAGLEEALRTFLDGAGRTVAVTRPVFLTDLGVTRLAQGVTQPQAGETQEPSGLCELSPSAAEALRAGEDLSAALQSHAVPYRGPVAVAVDEHGLVHDLPALAQSQGVGRLMAGGVRFIDCRGVYVGPRVTVEPGTLILPNVILQGDTHVGKNCRLGPNALLQDVTVGEGSAVNASQCLSCAIGSFTTVGPFAYLRPGTAVGDHVRVGDFVELKNAAIGHETKISHLAYLGDCDVGEASDIGCGTVTVNFDGARKFRTRIGSEAFIGCNTNLVAPVSVGDGAYVAAGSTITRDVPSGSLAIARSQQTVKHNWAKKRRARQEKDREKK